MNTDIIASSISASPAPPISSVHQASAKDSCKNTISDNDLGCASTVDTATHPTSASPAPPPSGSRSASAAVCTKVSDSDIQSLISRSITAHSASAPPPPHIATAINLPRPMISATAYSTGPRPACRQVLPGHTKSSRSSPPSGEQRPTAALHPTRSDNRRQQEGQGTVKREIHISRQRISAG